MRNYTWQTFPNIGFITYKFTNEELANLKQEIEEISTSWSGDKINHRLVGHIQQEYNIVKSRDEMEALIKPLLYSYDQQFSFLQENVYNKEPKFDLEMDSLWVNYQFKGEYNPVHKHRGLFSFVIWMNIPYSLEEEDKLYVSSIKTPGRFAFLYTDALGSIKQYPIDLDRSFENTIAIFPSKMDHIVYPFYTSDEYRISVAGNFVYK